MFSGCNVPFNFQLHDDRKKVHFLKLIPKILTQDHLNPVIIHFFIHVRDNYYKIMHAVYLYTIIINLIYGVRSKNGVGFKNNYSCIYFPSKYMFSVYLLIVWFVVSILKLIICKSRVFIPTITKTYERCGWREWVVYQIVKDRKVDVQKLRNILNTTIAWLTSCLSYAYNYFINEFGWKVQPLWY